MRRREIRLVDLEPAVGSEASKLRPAVIVSNDGANTSAAGFGRGVVTVLPLTSNVGHIWEFQVLIPATESGLHRDSKVQVEQIRAVDVSRVGHRVGVVPSALMSRVDDAIRLHLGL